MRRWLDSSELWCWCCCCCCCCAQVRSDGVRLAARDLRADWRVAQERAAWRCCSQSVVVVLSVRLPPPSEPTYNCALLCAAVVESGAAFDVPAVIPCASLNCCFFPGVHKTVLVNDYIFIDSVADESVRRVHPPQPLSSGAENAVAGTIVRPRVCGCHLLLLPSSLPQHTSQLAWFGFYFLLLLVEQLAIFTINGRRPPFPHPHGTCIQHRYTSLSWRHTSPGWTCGGRQ
jgi:hypothetical protein